MNLDITTKNLDEIRDPALRAYAAKYVQIYADFMRQVEEMGVEVDGQDVLAVYQAAGEAIARARRGEGPSLLECQTYRYVGHHEGDPGTGYRTLAEVEQWKQRDPIRLFRHKLLGEKLATEAALDQLQEQIEDEIAQAVKFGEASPWPAVETVGDKVFYTA